MVFFTIRPMIGCPCSSGYSYTDEQMGNVNGILCRRRGRGEGSRRRRSSPRDRRMQERFRRSWGGVNGNVEVTKYI